MGDAEDAEFFFGAGLGVDGGVVFDLRVFEFADVGFGFVGDADDDEFVFVFFVEGVEEVDGAAAGGGTMWPRTR